MEMLKGDLFDRFTILQLKKQRLPENYDINKEYNLYDNEIENIDTKDILEFIGNLYEYNGKIWDLESDLRKGKEKLLGLDEVGKRAIMIRDINNKRVENKNKINDYFNEPKDIKIDHISENEK